MFPHGIITGVADVTLPPTSNVMANGRGRVEVILTLCCNTTSEFAMGAELPCQVLGVLQAPACAVMYGACVLTDKPLMGRWSVAAVVSYDAG